MSQEGILKYPPPFLLPLEGPEICLHDRSIPIEILTKQHFTLIFSFKLHFLVKLVQTALLAFI